MLLGDLPLVVLTEELGVVAARVGHRLEPVLDVVGHRPEVPSRDVGGHVDAPRVGLPLDHVGDRPHPDLGDVAEQDLATRRGVQREGAMSATSLRDAGVLQTTTS